MVVAIGINATKENVTVLTERVVPFTLMLVYSKTFIIISFGDKQLLEVGNTIQFAIVQGVTLHPQNTTALHAPEASLMEEFATRLYFFKRIHFLLT